MTPKHKQDKKERQINWTSLKLKTQVLSKDTIKKVKKTTYTMGGNIRKQ